MKFSKSVDCFKNNLSKFKCDNFDQIGHHWELSSEIFNRISDTNRENYVTFVTNNPHYVKRLNINTRVTFSITEMHVYKSA